MVDQEAIDLVYRFTGMELVQALICHAVARGDCGPSGYSLETLVLEGSPADGFTLTLPAHTRHDAAKLDASGSGDGR